MFRSNQLFELKPGVPVSIFRANSNGAGGNTFDAQGRLYTLRNAFPQGHAHR